MTNSLLNFQGCITRDSNVRRSREVTEKGRDVRTIADCGSGLSAYAMLACADVLSPLP